MGISTGGRVRLLSNYIIPKTEGIKYAGSKLKIIPNILELISDLDINSVLDGFSGSTRVSQAFSTLGYSTTSNDISEWSETLATCYLKNTYSNAHYLKYLTHLNSLSGYDGWFTEHYGGDVGDTIKKPFQRKNTRKLDAIRNEIDNMAISKIEKSVLLTSLILALDKVDNTMGHHVSYLKKWSERSFDDLILQVPLITINMSKKNKVIKGDIFKTIKNTSFDLAYFDPPYGSNNELMPSSRVRYNSYYHIWTTVIKNDKPELFGKVNRRKDTKDTNSNNSSVFESYKDDIAIKAIEKVLKATNSKYILLSYNSTGKATKEELYSLIETSGTLNKAIEIDYKKNVMSNMTWTNKWTSTSNKEYKEYLFLIEK